MYSNSTPEPAPIAVDLILRKLSDRLGVDFTGYRRSTIQRRLQSRILAVRCADESDYLRLLDRDSDECRALVGELTIKFSQFFRDSALWRLLASELLPEIIRSKTLAGKSDLKIWSAGSATGEEAYTAAMVVDRLLRQQSVPLTVEIVGSDIDNDALERARQGVYPPISISNVPEDYLRGYFNAGKTYSIIDGLKERVIFRYDDLLSPPPRDGSLQGFDLVFCRNVLIYLTRPLQQRVFERLACSLAPEGILVLGTAEVVPHQYEALFRELNRELRVLRLRS